MRAAVDTGGTFTDLVLEREGELRLYKSPTTPHDPVEGLLEVLAVAARDLAVDLEELLGDVELFVHGTTRAINAILTGATARTALLATAGHRDILLFREGGRTAPFDFTRPYPEPYVPRALTFEVPERVGADGGVVRPFDEETVVAVCRRLRELEVEAVAVCLLWSIVNPEHELRVGALLDRHLPGVPYSLSHRLNPTLREYRRASSTAIDASLKPLMTDYLDRLEGRLRAAGFRGRALVVTSAGGVLDAAAVAAAPIHSIGSGPAMAPVAGLEYARAEAGATSAIVADAGGTSFDVSLVRHGRIPTTQETWLGEPYIGHMTGFPSVDVKSIGAGGGSIAWVDAGGLLHVGPRSAGAVPGPVCYSRGGTEPTVTDAALVLGYIDPDYFLGGTIALDVGAARDALAELGARLGRDAHEAAHAVLRLTTDHMVRAIEEITLGQGIDPAGAVLVGGGGAAGLNAVAIARRLGCPRVVIPGVGAVLSAAGALLSDLVQDHARTFRTTSEEFDLVGANAVLAELEAACRPFLEGPGAGALPASIELSVESRYPHQIWELEVPLGVTRFSGGADVEQVRQDFHAAHLELFAISDPGSAIELVTWRARARCRLADDPPLQAPASFAGPPDASRSAYFPVLGLVEAAVRSFDRMAPGAALEGPAIVESPVTTVVVDPGATAVRTALGGLSIVPEDGAAARTAARARTAGRQR